ncbi:MAG TPA: phage recombination protein Bet [Enterococcus faecalis]|nr:phage recombination protein Bet [Enterococcus faecalis]
MANELTYTAGGQEIKLSPDSVSQFVTKGNGKITREEAYNFIQLCRYAELNPFLNEAYIVKFGNQPAQMITGKEAFMKRAERQKSYNGFKAGIVVFNSKGEIEEREGTIIIDGKEQLLGGWAIVFRKDRDNEYKVTINFDEFAKRKSNGELQSTWQSMPANMIRKSALVNALREAYPDQLGAMYTEDEPNLTEVQAVKEEKNEKTEEILEGFKSIVNEPDEEITEAEFEENPLEDEVDPSENEELESVGESNE